MTRITWMVLVVLAAFCLMLPGCGGGGGGPVAPTVSGVAAAGAVLSGTVYLKDSSNPAKELSKTINADGSFSFDVTGLTKPFLLKAVGSANGTNHTLYSFVDGTGTANINPMSHIVVTHAAGGSDLATLYNSPSAATIQSIAAKLATALQEIQTTLQPLLQTHKIANNNPISDAYVANHQGLDGMLDVIRISISNGTVTISNISTNAVIFTAPTTNIKSGTVAAGNIPQPPTTTGGGSTSGTTTARYPFYTQKNSAGTKDLYAFDPAAATSPLLIDTAVDGFLQVEEASLNSATRSLSNYNIRTIVYQKGGKIWKVSAVKDGSTPTPAQLSNETGLSQRSIGGASEVYSDLVNHSNSRILYRLPGPDGQLNTSDDVIKMVSLGMGPGDSPITIPISGLPYGSNWPRGFYAADGSVAGFVVLGADNVLKRYDVNFTAGSAVTLKTGVTTTSMTNNAYGNVILMRIDNALYAFNISTNVLSAPLYSFTSTQYSCHAQEGNLYYFADGARIYKMPLDGSSAPSLIIDEGSGATVTSIRLSSSRIVYAAGNSSSVNQVKSVPKGGGAATTLSTGSYNFIVGESYVYAGAPNYGTATASYSTVTVVKDDGTGLSEIPNARLAFGYRGDVINGRSTVAKVAIAKSAGSGETLEVRNTTDNSSIQIGSLPAPLTYMGRYGLKDQLVATATELYYFNIDTPNSLKKIATGSFFY